MATFTNDGYIVQCQCGSYMTSAVYPEQLNAWMLEHTERHGDR